MSMQAKNKWEWMVEEGKEGDSHPFTSPQKMDGIPQFPSKICGVLDGYHPFEDGYPSLCLCQCSGQWSSGCDVNTEQL